MEAVQIPCNHNGGGKYEQSMRLAHEHAALSNPAAVQQLSNGTSVPFFLACQVHTSLSDLNFPSGSSAYEDSSLTSFLYRSAKIKDEKQEAGAKLARTRPNIYIGPEAAQKSDPKIDNKIDKLRLGSRGWQSHFVYKHHQYLICSNLCRSVLLRSASGAVTLRGASVSHELQIFETTHMHCTAKLAPGLGILNGSIKAVCPLLPASLSPVHPGVTAATTQNLHHFLHCQV